MNHTNEWMGGGVWMWVVLGLLVVVAVVFKKLSRK